MFADAAGSIVRAAFDRFDLNGDGALDAHEIKTVMAEIGTLITDLEVAEMVVKADISGDGRIQLLGPPETGLLSHVRPWGSPGRASVPVSPDGAAGSSSRSRSRLAGPSTSPLTP